MTYAVTIMYGTPAEFDDLLAYCSAANRVLPHSVKTVLLGAAPIPPSYAARFQDALAPHTRVWCLYGMTEVLPVCCTTLAEKARSVAHGDLIGHPFPGVMVRCAPDGELLVRAAHLCKGYLGGPPMVEHATGDLGRVDSDGCITLVGRKKDMIIRKGHNVYPTLFEPTIARIAGVRACSMIGVYNDRTSDEEVVLIVEVDGRHDEQRFRRFLQRELLTGPHSIDAYAQPDAILFMPVPVHGRSRKTDKEALRRILSRGYRSADPPRDGAAPHGASSGG